MLIQINTNIAATTEDLLLIQNNYLKSSSVHINNNGKDTLINVEGPWQGLDEAT